MKNSPFTLLVASLFALLTVTACSNLKVPASNQMAASGAAIDAAASGDAGEYAPVEMNLAQEKLKRARKAFQDKDYRLARDLAEQAQADASLAQSKASSGKAKLAADALQEDVRVLKEELQRNTP